MILNEGLNRIRDLINTDLDKGQSGTGTTLPTAGDAGLETAVAATLLDLTGTVKTDRVITTTHSVDSTLANGSNLTEHEVRLSSGDSVNRVVHASISKTVAIEIDYIDTFFIEGS